MSPTSVLLVIDSVTVLVGPRVRRFQGPVDDGRRCITPSNKCETTDEYVVRDDIRARA